MSFESLSDRIDRLWRATGRYSSERDFLRRCGISESFLSQYRVRLAQNRDSTISVDSAHRMARELGVSIETLIGADPLHLPDDEYPSRAEAVAAARLLRYPESAVMAVTDQHPSVDPGASYWFRLIEATAAAAGPIAVGQPSSGHRSRSRRQR